MKKLPLVLILFFCFTGTTHAQFFKKLAKKAEKAAERTVERRVERKASEKTDQVLDSTMDRKRKPNKGLGIPSLSKANPAASYAFKYKAKMQITSGKDVMNLHYFLPESGNFLGTLIIDEKIKDDFITVMDIDRNAMFTYMENNGQKIRMGVNFNTISAAEEAMNETSISISATGNTKKILGYDCQEYKMTGEDMTATIWVTKDAKVRFPNNFYNVKQDKNQSNQAWMEAIDGWAMEMNMIGTSRKKPQTITMKCLSIDESSMKINSNDYQTLGY
jgi:hypothetical protein